MGSKTREENTFSRHIYTKRGRYLTPSIGEDGRGLKKFKAIKGLDGGMDENEFRI